MLPFIIISNQDIMHNFCLRKNSNTRGSQIIVLPTLDKNKHKGGQPKWQDCYQQKAKQNYMQS